MKYCSRLIESQVIEALNRGKSVLLLGPRQVGKTTLVKQKIHPDISYSFASAKVRVRYEKDFPLFERELEQRIQEHSTRPIIFIDEVQKIPRVMDVVQVLIDEGLAQFVLTGSSARKLKHEVQLNLLPGRIVVLIMHPLIYDELPDPRLSLEEILLYGTLPGIIGEKDLKNRDIDLLSYVTTYLEEEIRAEALVRDVGHFSRFLEFAAGESGRVVNFSNVAEHVGVSHHTISNYYQILDDSLTVNRIDPITDGRTKRRLIKAPKYLFFDLGLRRACANEGVKLPLSVMADLFEHYVGNELIRYASRGSNKVKYWRDAAGPEVDFVLEKEKSYIPIEVKWSDAPKSKDARHLHKFLNEYGVDQGYIVCRTPQKYKINDRVMVLPWQEMGSLFDD